MAEKVVIDLEVDVNKSERTLGQLEDRAEALNEELRKVPLGSKAFKELKQELVGVNKEIKNTELAMESLDNEQVASELGSVAGAVGDLTAAFVLLGGDEDSAIGETAKRIETALGVTMAFKGTIEGVISFQKLWNNTIKKTAAVQAVYNAGQKAMNFVTNATTKATKLLRIAMLSLPFVAIGAAVVALVSNFKDIMKSMGFFNEEAQALKDTMDAFKSGTADATKKVSEMEATFDMARKGVISKEQALFEYNKTFGDTLGTATDLNEAEAIFVAKSDAYVKAAGLRAQADALFAKAAEKSADAMVAHMENNLTTTDNITAGITSAIFGAGQAIDQTTKAQDKRTKERQKLLNEQSDLFTKMATEMLTEAQKIENEVGIASEQSNAFEEKLETKRQERAKSKVDRINKEEQARFDLLIAQKEADAQEIQNEREKAEALINIETLKHKRELQNKELTDAEKELLEFEYQQRIAEISQAAIDKELEQEQAKADAQAEIDKIAKQEQAERDKQFEEGQKQLRQDIIDAEIGLQEAKLNAAKGLIAGLTELAGENEKLANALFIADKALAIGEIIVNTQREIAGIFAAYSTIPGGQAAAIPLAAAAKIRAATSIATIVASSIAKFKGGGGASIGGGVTGGSIAGAGATAPTIAPVTNTSTLVPQEPQQVFVTETDITNTQNQVAVIETQATIK